MGLSARDAYWDCIGKEGAHILQTTSMAPTDFALYLGGVCPNEAQQFTVAMVDFLAVKYPDIPTGTHMTSAKNAIELAQKNLVTEYIKLRSEQPKK